MTTLTPEAAAALLARMEELERVAEKATQKEWRLGLDPRNVRAGPTWIKPANYDNLRGRLDLQAEADARHIVAFQPQVAISLLSLIRWQRERIEEMEGKR